MGAARPQQLRRVDLPAPQDLLERPAHIVELLARREGASPAGQPQPRPRQPRHGLRHATDEPRDVDVVPRDVEVAAARRGGVALPLHLQQLGGRRAGGAAAPRDDPRREAWRRRCRGSGPAWPLLLRERGGHRAGGAAPRDSRREAAGRTHLPSRGDRGEEECHCTETHDSMSAVTGDEREEAERIGVFCVAFDIFWWRQRSVS